MTNSSRKEEKALSHSDNITLLCRYKNGEAALEEEILINNAGLVRSIAQRFLGRGAEYDDLYQLGMIGLLRAVRSFDVERGFAFSTYAVPLIIGEIKRFLRDDGIIKVSRDKKRLGSQLLYEKEMFEKEHSRDAHISELAEICGVSVDEAAEALEASYPVRSIYEPLSEDGELSLSDTLTAPDSDETMNIALGEVTSQMPEIWQKIVSLRYYHDMSQERTAKILGLTQVKISREEKKIFEYYRQKLS